MDSRFRGNDVFFLTDARATLLRHQTATVALAMHLAPAEPSPAEPKPECADAESDEGARAPSTAVIPAEAGIHFDPSFYDICMLATWIP